DIESRSDAQHSTPAAPRFAKRHVPIEGNFAEGWKQTVALLESDFGAGGQVKLSVERGWLCARRESSGGRLEWQFVLCRIDNSTLPEIEVMANMPSFIDISYRDRRYFIRESTNILRAMREVAPASPLLAKDSLLSLGAKRSGWGKSPDWVGITCSAWVDADWFFVATGPDEQSWRSVVRLDPMEMPGGHGVRTTVEGHIRYFHGDKWLIDGELLLADRTTLPMHESMKKQTAAREAILAGKLPAIDATAWLNTDDPSTWDTLKGKVVLLDFWGTWCGPCVAKLPDIQKLHEKYSDRGLVVLAVHSQQGADACAAFVKEQGYAFPVALDSGKTAEAYSISSWPTYFLVDRAGNVVQGFVNEPPSAAAIEALLGGANSQKGREDPQSSQEVARAAPPVRLVQATQRVTVNRNRPPALLAYGDGKADGKKSYGGSGHLIRFELPEGVTKVRGIRIHSSRYGYPQAPDENAEITFLSDDRGETLHSEATPYHLFKRGKESWVRVMFDKEVELPEKFWVALNFNAQQTKGVYVSYDTSTKGEYSRVGLPGDEEEPKKTDFNGDWMVQLMLTRPK
ncbi:MAG: TlpA disulfide reductase family protein, partial [Pirellulales bacterium]